MIFFIDHEQSVSNGTDLKTVNVNDFFLAYYSLASFNSLPRSSSLAYFFLYWKANLDFRLENIAS